jgi:hypothetical protein
MTDLPADQGQAPRRAFPRLQLGISAQLETLEGRQRVRLMDLSQGGARIVLSQPGDIKEGVLTWIRFETFGVVAWEDEKSVGLEFDKPLPLAVLVETRQRAPSVVREEEERIAREWVEGSLGEG